MSDFEALLGAQDLDVRADQLAHRRANLPERQELNELLESRKAAVAESETIEGQRDTLARDQKRLEDEAASVEAKAEDHNAKVYSGDVTSPRELTAMQDEIASLKRRQTVIEDQVLELMEQIEPLTEDLARRAGAMEELDARAAELEAAVTAAEAEIAAEQAQVGEERERAVQVIAPDLLAEYESLRNQLGGVGAAKLNGSTCMGCHLTLSAIEVDRIKKQPSDAIIHCEECGRILVR
jgi:predicted  nucleic acid-binding Zn-ribbon protein